MAALSDLLAWIDTHQLVSWLVGSAAANVLVDVLGRGDGPVAQVARALGVDLRRVISMLPAGRSVAGPEIAEEPVPAVELPLPAPPAPPAPPRKTAPAKSPAKRASR